jgi:NAD(P)-dependent dehydrogenase (short-subunit alcohol dehydrogenase family)
MELAQRVAIVTGAAVGTGRAIALRLAAEGAAVVLADVDTDGARETCRRVAAGGRAEVVTADLRRPDDVVALVAAAEDRFGRLDVLVNNAGGGGHVPPHFPAATPAEWGALLDLNLRGPMLATQLAVHAMRGEGVVVNVASTAGLGQASYQSPEYAAAKAGLIRFTSSLTGLPAREGVRVTCVVPDWVATDRAMRELAAMSPAERSAAPVPIPLDRLTAAVVRLIRDDALDGAVVVLRPGEPDTLFRPELGGPVPHGTGPPSGQRRRA